MDKADSSCLDFLKTMERVHGLKRKRLRFLKLTTVNREMIQLREKFLHRDTFKDEFSLNDLGMLSPRALDILIGLFGQHMEAREILELDRRLIVLDGDIFRSFLDRHIGKPAACRNLYSLLLGDEESMRSLARYRLPYLERYFPAMRAVDEISARNLAIRHEQAGLLEHIITHIDEIADNLERDTFLYRKFSRDLRSLYHEPSRLSIIGYGEISTVMEISRGGRLDDKGEHAQSHDPEWIWKKMPPFPSLQEAREFERHYIEYRRIITADVGIDVPEQKLVCHPRMDHCIVYAGQKRIDPSRVCHHLIRNLGHSEALLLFQLILSKFALLHSFNSSGGRVRIGFDGQLSNWVHCPAKNGNDGISADDNMIYIDTSSPLIRVDGKEQLNVELFIKNAPSFLRFLLKKLFLQEVVDRYYDLRSVLIDLIANLHKEQRPDLIDDYISLTNTFINEKGLGAELSRKEIDDYYARDANIWRFYQAARRVDKFFIEKILRRKYNLRLPGKVQR